MPCDPAEGTLQKLEQVLDKETFEQVAEVWAVKKHLRRILNAPSIDYAQNTQIDVELAVAAAPLPEANRFSAKVANRWGEVKVLIRNLATNARTEARSLRSRR